MKRSNKLYEAIAIVQSAQSHLALGINSLKLNKQDRALLMSDAEAAYKALGRMSETLDALITRETGLTELDKWTNAARVLGGAK